MPMDTEKARTEKCKFIMNKLSRISDSGCPNSGILLRLNDSLWITEKRELPWMFSITQMNKMSIQSTAFYIQTDIYKVSKNLNRITL